MFFYNICYPEITTYYKGKVWIGFVKCKDKKEERVRIGREVYE